MCLCLRVAAQVRQCDPGINSQSGLKARLTHQIELARFFVAGKCVSIQVAAQIEAPKITQNPCGIARRKLRLQQLGQRNGIVVAAQHSQAIYLPDAHLCGQKRRVGLLHGAGKGKQGIVVSSLLPQRARLCQRVHS